MKKKRGSGKKRDSVSASDLSIDKTLSDDSIAELSTSRGLIRRQTTKPDILDTEAAFKNKEDANA